MAMLHSFWYQEAERAFGAVASADPGCAMAYWGVAMSRYHQHWEHPTPTDVQVAIEALERARAIDSTSERERAYIAAIGRFYQDTDRVGHLERALAYEAAMRELQARYPDDPEATVFYALALLRTASSSPPDPTFARQREAAAILEGLLPSHPAHPGVAHYLIHASDYAPLAERGLEAALPEQGEPIFGALVQRSAHVLADHNLTGPCLLLQAHRGVYSVSAIVIAPPFAA